MRKHSWKKKEQMGAKTGESNNTKQNYDNDTAAFIGMSQEFKDEGNRLLQNKDYELAMLKYEKAIKLLPGNHIDVSYLRSNMAECYIQMGVNDYPRAIHECNLALEVTPKYSKALVKRARCYEGLERFELAKRDVITVLKMEPKNVTALEIFERVKRIDSGNGIEPPQQPLEKKTRKKKVDDKLVVEEKMSNVKLVVEEGPKRNIKLVFGEDIRWAPLPINCSVLKLREIISERFPSSKAVLVKYKDQEGDLVTITTNEELRWAEACGDHGSIKLYIVEVRPEQDPLYYQVKTDESICKSCVKEENVMKRVNNVMEPTCIDDWIIQFAQIFKNYVGLDSDGYLGIHELGFKVYSEAMEEAVTSEEAQDLFNTSAEKFQEMAALALFNWGNVHMSQAKKRLYFIENEYSSVKAQVFSSYDWARSEYMKAGRRYEEALKIKPDFYEAVLALGQQQFEQAKLSWYYALANNDDLKKWPFSDVVQLYNYAEDNMDKGLQMWETAEEKRINELSKPSKVKIAIQEMGLGELFKNWSEEDEIVEKSSNMRSQINVLWGKMLYERSSMEFKLELPVWHECFEIAIEKFELAGASETDIALIVKNHCSNDSSVEGIGFKIDEIVQAWNEMYEAKRWETGVRSFRLEPVLRRRVSKLFHDLEHV